MMQFKRLVSILAGFAVVGLLPLLLVATYGLGLTPVAMGQQVGVMYGIVAYSWLMVAMYVGTKPAWVESLFGKGRAGRMTKVLSVVALLFTGFHKELNPATGLVGQTGQVALMVLISFGLYWLLFGTTIFSNRLSVLSRLQTVPGFTEGLGGWLQGLLLVANAVTFVHTLVIDTVRANSLFLLTFLAFSLPLFVLSIWGKLVAPAQEVSVEERESDGQVQGHIEF